MTAVVIHQPQSELAIKDDQTEFNDKQRYALGLGQNVTPADLAIYFHVCRRTGLDPFAKQIHMIERWTKEGPRQTIQTGIDGYRLIAQRTDERTRGSHGYEDQQWCGEDGQWRDVWLSDEPPAAARVVVIRDGQRYPAIALFCEYEQTYKDKRSGEQVPTPMWKDRAAGQLAKCAEALALRKAYPVDLSGLYTDDEMHQADSRRDEPRQRPTGLDAVRAKVAHQTDAGAAEPPHASPEEPAREEASDGRDAVHAPASPKITASQQRKLFALFKAKGITEEEQLPGIAHVIGRPIESRTAMTPDEFEAVVTQLEARPDAITDGSDE